MPEELSLRDELKGHSLGLASLARTIARHRSRIRYLEEGDANTKFFHLQACHRSRKNVFERLHSLHLDDLLPRLDLTGIDACFTEEEIWATVKELPPDRAPGLDGFTGRFYKVAWGVIKQDIINVFNALWSLDARSFHLLNDAFLLKNDLCTSKWETADSQSLLLALEGLQPKQKESFLLASYERSVKYKKLAEEENNVFKRL
jgi:hypothetical protein